MVEAFTTTTTKASGLPDDKAKWIAFKTGWEEFSCEISKVNNIPEVEAQAMQMADLLHICSTLSHGLDSGLLACPNVKLGILFDAYKEWEGYPNQSVASGEAHKALSEELTRIRKDCKTVDTDESLYADRFAFRLLETMSTFHDKSNRNTKASFAFK